MGGNSISKEVKIITNEISIKPNNYKELFSNNSFNDSKIKIKEIGSKGKKSLQFKYPKSIFFDEKNEIILISDYFNNRIQIINSINFEFINFIDNNGEGSNENQFWYPQGININQNNQNIFICDSQNNRIKIYENFSSSNSNSSKIKFLNLFNFYLNQKNEKINFNNPNQIEIDYLNDQILISNRLNNEILILNSSFNFIFSINQKNKFNNDDNELIRAREIKLNSQNEIIISDSKNISYFNSFSSNFDFLFSINKENFGKNNRNSMIYFTIDYFDNLIVSDYYDNSIKFFNPNGNLISSFGNGKGSNLNQFNFPLGICFGNKNQNSILICDSGNHKIKIIDW